MQRHCGVFRTLELLNEGVTQIEDLAKQADNIYFKDKSKVFNTARVEALELANMTEWPAPRSSRPPTAPKAAARMRWTTTRPATTRTG